MAAPLSAACRRYVMLLAHEHIEFRLPEVLSLAKLFNIPLKIPADGYNLSSPYMVVDLPSEECAKKIMSRTVVVKSIFELWGQGKTYEELKKNIQMYPTEWKEPFFAENKSFCIKLESFNKVVSMPDKIKKFELITSPDTLPFQGRVDLKNPNTFFQLLEYYGMQTSEPPANPYIIYFGRWVADGQRSQVINYHLDKRKFIGNTSMDAGLSFIMSNMGKVQPGDFVFDPFVGTGSLLVSAAHFGAYVMGTDLDYKIIHGIGRASRHNQKWRGQDENIRANLRQYGRENCYLDVLVADSSQQSMWRRERFFDAIITDPPYGIREKTKKVAADENIEIPDEHKNDHFPRRVEYELSELILDLLNFSAKHLRLGGRLVFWLPVYRPEYVEENVPQHPCFQLMANSEQALSSRIGRRLITMEKVKEYEEKDNENKARWIQDHFKDESFRDRYFRADGKPSREHFNTEWENTSKSSVHTPRDRNRPDRDIVQSDVETSPTDLPQKISVDINAEESVKKSVEFETLIENNTTQERQEDLDRNLTEDHKDSESEPQKSKVQAL